MKVKEIKHNRNNNNIIENPIKIHNSEIASYFSEQVEQVYGTKGNEKAQSRPREQICPNMLNKVITGVCTNCRTVFKKRMFCGKQWCPVCGAKNSVRHNNIISRLMPAYYEMGILDDTRVLGYMTIPFASEIRESVLKDGFDDAFGGSKQNKTVWQFTKKWLRDICGVTVGSKHVHVMGDDANGDFHPHIHIIFDIPEKIYTPGVGEITNPAFEFTHKKNGISIAYMKKDYLTAFKSALLDFYKYKYPEQTKDLKKAVVHFEYRSGLGAKYHCITYSTQARLTVYRKDLADFIYKKCVNRRFGFQHGKKYEKTTQEVWELFHKKLAEDSGKKAEKFEFIFPDLLESVCIVCDGEIEWSGIEKLEHEVDYYSSREYTKITGKPPPLQYLGEGVFVNVPAAESILNNIKNSKNYMSDKEFKKRRQKMKDKQDLNLIKNIKRKEIAGFL